jgi:protein-disulfide isomerase
MTARPVFMVVLVGLVSTGATCRNSEEKPPPPPAANGPKAPAVTEIPDLDLASVDPGVRADALRLLNDNFCYCGCPRTIAACLANKSECSCVQCSERMAKFILAEYGNGASTEDVEAQLLGGFSEGFNGAQKTFAERDQPTKGPKEATFVIVEFADFACPHCAGAFDTLNELISKRSDVRLDYYYYPLSFNGEKAVRAAEAAEEARRQGKFWEMAKLLFDNQLNLSESEVTGYAQQVGLDMAAFEKALSAHAHRDLVMADKKLGEASGVESTPSFFVNGRPFGLGRTLENFEMRFQMEAERGTCR